MNNSIIIITKANPNTSNSNTTGYIINAVVNLYYCMNMFIQVVLHHFAGQQMILRTAMKLRTRRMIKSLMVAQLLVVILISAAKLTDCFKYFESHTTCQFDCHIDFGIDLGTHYFDHLSDQNKIITVQNYYCINFDFNNGSFMVQNYLVLSNLKMNYHKTVFDYYQKDY